MALRGIDTLGPLEGRTVLVRCDLNVPLKDGVITDDGRVRASAPTLRSLLDRGARVVAMSHLGRPDGAPDPKYSLRPVATRLSELLGEEVAFAEDTVGPSARAAVEGLGDGSPRIALLENLRFDPRETSKVDAEREAFATELAGLGDVVVSDGFGAVHRKHASVYDLERILPSAAGDLVVEETEVLERLTETPERPYAVVLGGSKVSDKLGVIGHLLPRVDAMLIGGGMLFTFLAAQGMPVGKSLLEADQLDTVRGYVDDAERRGVELLLPTDVVVAASFAADAEHRTVAAEHIEDTPWGSDGIGLDIGPETAAAYAAVIERSRTVFWNGPMGVFEFPAFAAGTRAVADALTRVAGLGVVGGGDSAAAIRQLGFTDDEFGHVSTGGGASLEFVEGRELPGLEVLGWQR